VQTIQKARLKSGQFAPGQSGNPGGRSKDEHRVAELARSYTLEALDTLVELMCEGQRRTHARNGSSGAPRPRLGRRSWKWLQALRAAIWTS